MLDHTLKTCVLEASATLTPLQIFENHYCLPTQLHGQDFILHPLQVKAINELAPNRNGGNFLDTGTGKTVVETVVALYNKVVHQLDTIVVIMPPILIPQWAKWLSNVTHKDGRPLRVTQYKGTPKQRQDLDLDVDFLLIGIQIFKIDNERLAQHYSGRRYMVAVDEANMLSDINTANHQAVFDFASGQVQHLLTGTPANNPMDAYGILKFTAPGTYRSKRHFENMHVADRDFYGNPTEYQNLDMLRGHLEINSVRVLFEDMYPDADVPLFVPLPYDLEPAHYKLYQKLANEQLLLLPDGGKIDATQANKLTHALGQIIVNWGHFAADPKLVSTAVTMVEQRLSETNGKMVVFANYKLSIALLMHTFRKHGAVAINGEVSPAEKERAVQAFVNDPKCKLIFINPRSGGVGLDGLQHVCHHAMFLEPTQSPREFHQAVARLKRTGQRKRPIIALPTAQGTLQVRAFKNLLNNDATVNSIVRNASDLRSLVFGG